MWVKVVHLAAVISWMAGLLYLPRLFVYHRDTAIGGEASELFKTMERRLLVAIMMPAMIVTLFSGLILAHQSNLWFELWFMIKVLSVLLMILSHFYMIKYQKAFARDERPLTSKGFRYFNEVPTLLMLIILVAVIIKPSY